MGYVALLKVLWPCPPTKSPGGGGGHCLFEGRYTLPNYRFSALSPLNLFVPPPIFEGHRPCDILMTPSYFVMNTRRPPKVTGRPNRMVSYSRVQFSIGRLRTLLSNVIRPSPLLDRARGDRLTSRNGVCGPTEGPLTLSTHQHAPWVGGGGHCLFEGRYPLPN